MIPGRSTLDDLAELIRAALSAQYRHGQADGRNTFGTPLDDGARNNWRRQQDESREDADTAAMAVWGAFHRLAAELATRAVLPQPAVDGKRPLPGAQA